MRKINIIRSAFFCCGIIVLNGCNHLRYANIDSDKDVVQTNDSLKICMPENDSWVSSVVGKFKEKYPEVKVELQIISDDNVDEQGKVIASELMAGDGADIYICAEDYFEDLYKIQNAGAFENLMPWFEKKSDFKKEDYVEGTFDLYEDTEKCYVMPLEASYFAYGFFTDMGEILGVDIKTIDSMEDIEDVIWKFYEAYPDDIAFSSSGAFYVDYMSMGYRIWKKNMEIFDLPEIKRMEETYRRQAYPKGEPISHMDYDKYEEERNKALNKERPCLGLECKIFEMDNYIKMGGEKEAVLVPIYTNSGKTATFSGLQNAIAAKSHNKENAFHMLEMLMEQSFQNPVVGTVNKKANQVLVENLRKQYGSDQIFIDGEVYDGLTDQTFERIETCLSDMEVYSLGTIMMGEKYQDIIEPFYRGEKQYEDCIKEFKAFLETYYTE